ncbi:E3 ubiquitin-protein ligase RNF125 [Grammomys surdaster]|uniref:E3 ubiquitin-protein ligase RNF125 n=1 Tax=Grammomys surdaster TaxID=491861 RepID=UPI00109F0DA4|nr:E3 ubiquitin-protein ligase RNF125 [Grammomys surdaster]
MGSLLSSDSSKSASASAAPRTPERSGHPELPITSFDCSVCLEVLHQPFRTRCGHVFCRSCIATSIKNNNKWTCPYCRAYLPSEGVPATDIAKRMKSEYQNCTECGTLVCLSDMRAHIRTCEKYIDKYGPLQELGETTARCACPFCERELDEDCLLDHCIIHHRSERRPVFCPICRSRPNESPSTSNGSLIRHLQVNHTFSLDDFIDIRIIEEAIIHRVLDRSLLEYVNQSDTT